MAGSLPTTVSAGATGNIHVSWKYKYERGLVKGSACMNMCISKCACGKYVCIYAFLHAYSGMHYECMYVNLCAYELGVYLCIRVIVKVCLHACVCVKVCVSAYTYMSVCSHVR